MSFQDSLKVGKTGETLFATYLKQQGIDFKDVTEDERYQKIDVDFISCGNYYEVKTDRQFSHTGNFAIEMGWYCNDLIDDYDNRGWKQGWYHVTQADYLVYADINDDSDSYRGSLYFIKMEDLEAIVNSGKLRNAYCKRDSYKDVELKLLPYWKYKDYFKKVDVWVF